MDQRTSPPQTLAGAAAALLAGEYSPVIELLTLAGAVPPETYASVRRDIAVPITGARIEP